MMERGRFDELVEAIERRYENRPQALKRSTWFWLLLGYGVVIAMTVTLIGGGLAVFIQGTLIPGAGVFLILLGGVLITFGLGQIAALVLMDQAPPTGRKLEADEAPDLHRLIELLRTDLDVPAISSVLLTDDYNAAVVQHPRLGIFGWPKQWLILGVPLLLSMSTQEAASVIAHEFGHLSRRHGQDGNRIYRMHRSWEQLFATLQNNRRHGFVRFTAAILIRFLNWYWPRFHARAFLQSRQQEFQADRIAADSTNSEFAASALWRIECTSQLLNQEFWKSVWDLTESQPEPPADLCARLRKAFQHAPESAGAKRWCEISLKRVSGNEDTHPSMSERIRALDIDPQQLALNGFPPAPLQTAADRLLGTDCAVMEEYVSSHWRNSVMVIWQDRHRRVTAIRRLSRPNEAADQYPSMTAAELWDQTRRIADVQGLEAAEPELRLVLARQPDHVGATFALGQLRMIQGHPDGEDILAHVVSLQNREWTQPAGQALEQHFAATGRKDQARAVRLQLDAFEKARKEAEKERSAVTRSDHFLDHGLSESELSVVKAGLKKAEHCQDAWLARKELKHFAHEALFVLAVDSGKSAGSQRANRNDRLITSLMLNVEVPGRLFVVTPTGEFRSAAGAIMKQPGWKIFERPAN
ncbi:MAG: M48 family metallopeptidase [Planctomycetaceae bacterium]